VVVRVAAIDRISKDELGKQLRLKACSDQLPVSSAFLQRFRGAGARGTDKSASREAARTSVGHNPPSQSNG
jgi:hypothetical protein